MTELTQQDRQHAAELMNRAGLAFDARDVGTVALALRQFEVEAAQRLRDLAPPADALNSSWELGFRRGHHMAADALVSGHARTPPADAPRSALQVVP